MPVWMPMWLPPMVMAVATATTGEVHALAAPSKTYRYFGYGSNVVPSTMRALRGIEVLEVTAAVLPDYELRFASAAFVRSVAAVDSAVDPAADGKDARRNKVVHGLLYTLAEEDFAKVGRTEGVPFGYRWQSCRVYPYRGDGRRAGAEALQGPDAVAVQAYTLVEPGPARWLRPRGDVPPSASYLGLIREGARLWNFDRAYREELGAVRTARSKNLLLPDGWEGPALRWAEKATGTDRTYMIDDD